MNRLGSIGTLLALGLPAALSSCSGSSGAATGAMYVESCTLNCNSGSTGQQISCGVANTFENQEIGVLFSKPVRFASVSKQSFQVTDSATTAVPPGTYLIDPFDSRRVIFRPLLSFDAQGNPVFGFRPGASYDILIPGTKQGDSAPFIESQGGTRNGTRMACSFTTQGISDPVFGPPLVSAFVDTVNPANGAIATGVPANNAVNVLLSSKITLVFNDLMNIGTLVVPGTGTSPSITVRFDPDGNIANSSDQVTIPGTFTYNLDQIALQTTLVFTPSQPFPSAGPNPLSPRQVIVNLPATIKDLTGNGIGNPGPVVFTPQQVNFTPVTIPVGGEQFTNLANCDQDRTGAFWGEATVGRLTPGLGGGSGRLGDLRVSAGETKVLRTSPTFGVGRIQFLNSGPLDGDIIDINGALWFISDSGGAGTGNGFIEFEGDFAGLTMTNLVNELNNSIDPRVSVATYSIENTTTLKIVYDTVGATGTNFTFDAYKIIGGLPVPTPSVVSISGPTIPGGTAHLLDGVDAESFAAGQLLDNYDFQANPGTVPGPVAVTNGTFEFTSLNIETGGVLRFEGANPARILVRGKATVSGVIDVSGQSLIAHESDTPWGQLGGIGGPAAGDGGRGGDRPDNSNSNLLAPDTFEPFRPFNFGIRNPPGFFQGRAGEGVGDVGTIAAGSAGIQYPSAFPQTTTGLNGMETGITCISEQMGGSGGGGGYSLNGAIGVAVASTPVSSQGNSNTPSDTPGGDAANVGLEAPTAPPNKRKLSPEKGFLKGGSGGGGGGGHVSQTRTNGAGVTDPCVGTGAVINLFRTHSANGGGGGGGGVQLQAGRSVVLGGGIDASGGDGGSSDINNLIVSATQSSPGGGGSGGAILLQARQLFLSAVPNRMSIAGGLGGTGFFGSQGGNGGPGLARVEAQVAPNPAAVAQIAAILEPIDGLDPLSTNYLSTGAWARSRFVPASFQGAQSCWMRPSGSFFALQFDSDVGAVPGWDMDLVLNFGAGPVTVPYRKPNGILPGGQTYEEFWGQLLDRDLQLGEVGAPIVVRFQGAKLSGAMPDPCNVAVSGPTSPLAVGSLTPWVRHPEELNAYSPPPDMIRFVILFDASKTDFLNIVGVTNLRVTATPN